MIASCQLVRVTMRPLGQAREKVENIRNSKKEDREEGEKETGEIGAEE